MMSKEAGFLAAAFAALATGAGAGTPPTPFDYTNYAAVLTTYVNARNRVDYKGLKASPQQLRSFTARIARVDPAAFANWPTKDKVAFWINAYNALTLQTLIDRYPVKSSWSKSLLYPKNSIRQIGGVWTKIQHTVMGQRTTLDAIEHETLRKHFREPRIHMALVCAAEGCPSLRREPYEGSKLDEQFADQARQFLGNREKFRIDRGRNRVYLSSIFKWFGEDFIRVYGTSEKFDGQSEKVRAVLSYVSRHLPPIDASYLANGSYSVRYLDYDWSLNEQ